MKHRTVILLKITICILLIPLIISFSGCWNRCELDTLGIVMGIGLDKVNDFGKIQITAQVVKPSKIKLQGKESGSASQAFWNVIGTGDTVFSTLRDMTNKSDRKLFFPHNQVLIFGKSIAEDGVQKYIDFFLRDPEARTNVYVLISENTAQETLDVKSELENLPAINIAKLDENYANATSQTKAVRLREFTTGLISKTTSSTAPFVKISKNGDKKVAMISDTAVFKGDKLVGRMDKHEGRGLMWVLGEVKSGIIEVNDSNNSKVDLEIIHAGSKIVPEINNNKITIKVIIHEEGNIGEQTGSTDLSKLSEIAFLEKKKAEAIKGEVMSAVKKAQYLDADVFGFGDAVHKKYPKQWKGLEDNWNEVFKDIQVEVDVDAKLRLMGRISKPSTPEKEEK